MNLRSLHIGKQTPVDAAGGHAPILIVPYMWIGDFVRCHTVVKLLHSRWPDRSIDIVTNSLCLPLIDYMPIVRQGVVSDLPRKRLPFGKYKSLAAELAARHYGSAFIMPRTWKSALAPFLAGIPERVGFIGEARFILLNDIRWGEMRLPRMIDRCGALALPKHAPLPAEWPAPEIVVPMAEVVDWRARRGLAAESRPVVALAPGAVGPGKRWPTEKFAELARQLADDGAAIWILGGPLERTFAAHIVGQAGPAARDLTGDDLRDAILALKAANLAVANDSGLMHIAAAIGTPTIGIFGPTDPWLGGPLNPLVAALEPPPGGRCPACGKQNCKVTSHRRTADIPVDQVLETICRHLQAR